MDSKSTVIENGSLGIKGDSISYVGKNNKKANAKNPVRSQFAIYEYLKEKWG